MMAITSQQRTVLSALAGFIERNGYSPTVRNLCELVGRSSPSTVYHQLVALEQKGYVARTPRGFAVLRQPSEPAA